MAPDRQHRDFRSSTTYCKIAAHSASSRISFSFPRKSSKLLLCGSSSRTCSFMPAPATSSGTCFSSGFSASNWNGLGGTARFLRLLLLVRHFRRHICCSRRLHFRWHQYRERLVLREPFTAFWWPTPSCFPTRPFLFGFLVPMKSKYFVLIIGAIVLLQSYSATVGGQRSNVAVLAHLGGLACRLSAASR